MFQIQDNGNKENHLLKSMRFWLKRVLEAYPLEKFRSMKEKDTKKSQQTPLFPLLHDLGKLFPRGDCFLTSVQGVQN